VLLDEHRAAEEIVRCVQACLRHKRPVYIEVPHDVVDQPIDIPRFELAEPAKSDPDSLAAALDETLEMIADAKKPVLLAGVELHRFGVTDLAVKLAERANIPIASDLLSKSAVPENHPLYLGVYGGAISSDVSVRHYVESSDCVLMIGTFITDMSMGIYTAKLDRSRSVLATTESINVRYHRYDDVRFQEYLQVLANAKIKPKKFKNPNPHFEPKPLVKSELTDGLTMKEIIRIVSLNLDENCCVVSDVGDGLFGALGIRTSRRAEFIAPAYYLSMGFAVPASIGVSMANPALRPFVLVGDGAFQMTGNELSTAARLKLNPIVLVLNNEGYGTMRKIRDGRFNVISQWNYDRICDLVGGGSSTIARTKGELDGAIRRAMGSKELSVIDVRVPRDDMSPQLQSMSSELSRLRNAGTKGNTRRQDG
jgi:indolepyruvate decarboxylase